MKLRKVITTAGFMFAGVSSANAQLYMCQSCPAGSWSDGTFASCKNCLTTGVTACNSITGKATSCKSGYKLSNGTCSACPSGYYSASDTETSCTICPAGYYCPGGTDKEICTIQKRCYESAECYSAQTYSSAGAASCTVPKSIDKAIHELTGADETSGVLEANKPYLLLLGGGNGGDNKGYNFKYCNNPRYNTFSTNFSGGAGGRNAYLIIPKKDISYFLGSGTKGSNADDVYAAAGGGGGSWMIFQNTSIGAIVAGGGGGAPSAISNTVMGSQGGSGGAMGAGGGSGDWYGNAAGRAGGASGKLAGGNGGSGDHYGTGKGHGLCETLGNYCGGLGGSVDRKVFYTPVISDNTYGGTGGWSVKFENKTNEMSTLYNNPDDYCFTYDKYYAYRLPGNGSTGIIKKENFDEYVYIQEIHPEPFEKYFCTSCAKLYSLK